MSSKNPASSLQERILRVKLREWFAAKFIPHVWIKAVLITCLINSLQFHCNKVKLHFFPEGSLFFFYKSWSALHLRSVLPQMCYSERYSAQVTAGFEARQCRSLIRAPPSDVDFPRLRPAPSLMISSRMIDQKEVGLLERIGRREIDRSSIRSRRRRGLSWTIKAERHIMRNWGRMDALTLNFGEALSVEFNNDTGEISRVYNWERSYL